MPPVVSVTACLTHPHPLTMRGRAAGVEAGAIALVENAGVRAGAEAAHEPKLLANRIRHFF